MDRSFRKTLIVTALPIVLQQVLQNSLSFIDTLMIGQLGENQIAAVGLGNQVYFLIFVLLFGVSSGAAIFTSQYWGSGNIDGIQKTIGVSLSVGLSISAVFSVISIVCPQVVLRLFIDDVEVISLGNSYMRWVGISYMFVSASQVFSVSLRSTGDTMNPMRATLFSMLFNIVGNYVLIFVLDLGIAGAAIATTVSRLLEMVILLYVLKFRSAIPFSFGKAFSFDRFYLRDILRTALPVILDDGLWALGMTVYKAVYSHMGVSVLAASNISESVQNFFFVIQNSMGAAIAILIGNEIGRGNFAKARTEARDSLFYGVILGIVSGLLMALTSPLVPGLFNTSQQAREITRLALLALSVTIPVKFLNHIMITGILRSGGDTKFLLFTEVITIWCIGVPMAYLSGLVWNMQLWAVYLFVALEEFSKVIVLCPRSLGVKWMNDLTK